MIAAPTQACLLDREFGHREQAVIPKAVAMPRLGFGFTSKVLPYKIGKR
jgi:hypothetical protein